MGGSQLRPCFLKLRFLLRRTHVAQTCSQPPGVVPRLNMHNHLPPQLLRRLQWIGFQHAFALQCGKPNSALALSYQSVTDAPHQLLDSMRLTQCLKRLCADLTALIRIVNHTFAAATSKHHLQGLAHQTDISAGIHLESPVKKLCKPMLR